MRSNDVKKPLKLSIFMLDLMKSVDLCTSIDRSEYDISVVNWGKLSKAHLLEFFSILERLACSFPPSIRKAPLT